MRITMKRLTSAIFAAALVLAAGPISTRAGSLEPSSSIAVFRPDPPSVERFGSGYRYPQAGWIVLHIEGTPYERGFQHGRLMAPEIAGFIRDLAAYRSSRAPADAWNDLRLIADALFLRRFDPELIEEMKGIADGAAAAGAKHDGRPVDFLDVVTINADIETNFLENALVATATGLEGRRFREPAEKGPVRQQESHCSAFAATGPATADGQVVIGHITMWNLFHAYHYNVWLDIKPSRGHRVLMQTYPGSIMSGLDYYQNDAGLVVCETTLAQTKFDASGAPFADRIRRALQYADSIDQAVSILKQGNNGLYTNEWLLADTKTNEIAMFELGTHKSRLWRSSKHEWFGGTAGFYWGCNNAKDVEVRMETIPSLSDRPANPVFHPSDRDRCWLGLFDHKKKPIDVDFGFIAFTTPPLAASHSLDAKFTTTAMARELATWAKFGPPMGHVWEPTDSERRRFASIRPLIPNDWTVLRADPPLGDKAADRKPVDLALLNPSGSKRSGREHAPAWHGTLLPETDADTWLASAFAEYQEIVSDERAIRTAAHDAKLSRRDQDRLSLGLFAPTSRYLAAVARRGGNDIPLSEIRSDLRSDEWYDIASGKGVLILAELRSQIGNDLFDKFMDDFGRTHAGKAVSSSAFLDAVEKAAGKPLGGLKAAWLNGDALSRLGSDIRARKSSGRFWSVDSFERELDKTLIIHGTLAESDAQREAAQSLQRKLASRWANIVVPLKADQDVDENTLKKHHLLLVGRPATNRLTERFAKAFPVRFGAASFTVGEDTYAHPHTAIVAAGPNPLAPDRSVVVFAGMSAEGTWTCPRRFPDHGSVHAEVLVLGEDGALRELALPTSSEPPLVATDVSAK
jgi:hypothetical protein